MQTPHRYWDDVLFGLWYWVQFSMTHQNKERKMKWYVVTMITHMWHIFESRLSWNLPKIHSTCMSKLQLEQWHVICKWNLDTFFRWCFITLQSYGKSLEASNDFASYSWDNFLKSKFLSLLDIQNTSVLVWIWGWFLKQPKVHHLFSISFSMRSNEVTMNSNSCPHL